MQTLAQNYAAGRLELHIERADLPPQTLFDFAERQNPRRAFLFVSKVLGRHIPVSPAVMRDIHQRLADSIILPDDMQTLFVGMAETAVALGAGVFRSCRKRCPNGVYLTSTRHVFDAPVLAAFEENHSHAASHILYRPALAEFGTKPIHLVAVDDEMTTGNTFLHLCESLRAAGLPLQRMTRVAIMDWSPDDVRKTFLWPGETVSLLRGSWQWFAAQGHSPTPFPPRMRQGRGKAAVADRQDWGRFGMRAMPPDPWPQIRETAGRRVLVLGTGEFVWPPFLLAERLEQEGCRVRFGATTRSPIKPGLAIRSRLKHEDNYGFGIVNYLYNVDPQDYDSIYLCCETGAETLDAALLAYLRKAVVLEYARA